MDDSGNSYMVYSASKNGCFLAFGGGSVVTLSELEEAASKGIEPKIFPEFLPGPIKLKR